MTKSKFRITYVIKYLSIPVTSLSIAPAPPTLQELSTELDRVERWYELGVNLDFPGHQLREIEQDSPRCSSRCKLEMLDKWLRKSENPSWEAVAKALYLMKEYAVANQIRKKYCSSANTSGNYPSRVFWSPCRYNYYMTVNTVWSVEVHYQWL